MTVRRSWSGPRVVTRVGLVVGALGIAIRWPSGVDFLSSPSPGIIILLAGTLFVGLAPWRWAPGVGAFLRLFVTVGFLIGPAGLSNLADGDGTSVAIGRGLQVIGVTIALIAGVLATRANYRKPADTRGCAPRAVGS